MNNNDFFGSKNGLKFDNKYIDSLKSEFERIKHNADKPADSINFTELCCNCYRLVTTVPFPLIEISSENTGHILRARPNTYDEIFDAEWQLSYNSTDIDTITTNRFNLMRETMFYGSIPTMKSFKGEQYSSEALNKKTLLF